MTNPTLERAARAVCRSDYLLMPRYRKPGAEAALDAAVDDDWQAYVDQARAALMAVRSDEKIANMAYDAESVAHCDWGKIWERQIDAILNDGEGE